ncbi:hypothetical protein SESBI_47896 [Sesbania bispinosa]|nr:hypothetical protein SESBI_47896 [Sesbania bispinosa]
MVTRRRVSRRQEDEEEGIPLGEKRATTRRYKQILERADQLQQQNQALQQQNQTLTATKSIFTSQDEHPY